MSCNARKGSLSRRFLHTADWHLGKRLQGFSLISEQEEVLAQIADIARSEQPDAVVLAGDVFDTPIPPLGALELWNGAAEAIVGELGIPMIVIPGNHDHADRLGVNARITERAGLHMLTSLRDCVCPVVIADVHFYGLPFHKPAHANSAFRDCAPGIDDFDYHAAMRFLTKQILDAHQCDAPAVLMGHAFVEGAGDEDDGEDAIHVGGAGAVNASCFEGFSYVALGHLHSPTGIGEQGKVRYSGSPYPYSFSEAGRSKSVTLVEVNEVGASTTIFPLSASRQVRVLEGKCFNEVITEAGDVPKARRDDYLLVRVTDRDPVEQTRLREWYPNALLEQPEVRALASAPKLDGDYKTLKVEDAFHQFYQHVLGDSIEGLEEALLREVLQGNVGEDEEVAA